MNQDFWDRQPLGDVQDTELAARLGCSQQIVSYQRDIRGIERFRQRRADSAPWDEQPWGLVSNQAIALTLCRSLTAVKRNNPFRNQPGFHELQKLVRAEHRKKPQED